jgi:hypothetical protein
MELTNSFTAQESQSSVVADTNDLSLTGIDVSYSPNIHITRSTRRSFASIVENIRSDNGLKDKVAVLRKISEQAARQEFKKKNLDWFSFSNFTNGIRRDEMFLNTSYMTVDLDHLGENLSKTRTQLKADTKVFCVFDSPSGDGLKVIFHLDQPVTSEEEFRRKHKECQAYLRETYEVTVDTDDDPSRACFLSYDPEIYVNPSAERFTGYVSSKVLPRPSTAKESSQVLTALAGSSSPGRTAALTKIIGSFINSGYRQEYALELAKIWDQARNPPPLGDQKVIATVRDMYKRYWDGGCASKLERFYSYQSEIYDVGIVGEEFFMEKIGQKKFYILSESTTDDLQELHLKYVVKEKHIRHLHLIDHVGDMTASQSFPLYKQDEGSFEVHYAPLPARVQDNDFIDKWLTESFGIHQGFIKQWLAVYCYTNYRKLPTLVLKGDRGTGKNTFAEAVLSIFPSISQFWHGEEKNFTPEVQKKLLIADESVSANEKQYRMLKQRSGQKFASVNQKYLAEYQVRNNMNIIILSNEVTPIFVSKDEEPTSVKNNQFFVYTMPKLKGEIDPDFGEKITERMGHYIRTELKNIYENVKDIPGCRYSIPTPITDEEKALFNVNQTGLEEEGMKFLRKMVESNDEAFTKFFDKGLFPTSFVDEYNISRGYGRNGVIRNLKEKGWLKPEDTVRKMVNSDKRYCHLMTEKLKKWYQEERTAQ